MAGHKVVAYLGRFPHHKQWVIPFAQGMERHGCDVDVVQGDQARRCDVAVFWSHKFTNAMSAADNYVVLEAPPIRVGGYASAGWNGLMGRADFRNDGDLPDRTKPFRHLLKPYGAGDYVLIMGQCRGDTSTQGVDLRDWVRTTAAEVRSKTDAPVYFRPHPLDGFAVKGVPTLPQCDLDDALAGAQWVITYNSTAGVDAAMAGRAVSAYDPGSMVWDIAGHGCEFLRIPERREPWFKRLAWCQWTESEMANGDAWEHLKDH